MSWELMSYGELMSGGTNVLDSFIPNPGVLQNLQQGLLPMKKKHSDDETSLDLSHWCMMSITDPPGTRRAVETLIP